VAVSRWASAKPLVCSAANVHSDGRNFNYVAINYVAIEKRALWSDIESTCLFRI